MAEWLSEGFRRVARQLGDDVVGRAVEGEHGLGAGSGIVVQTSTRGVMWHAQAGNWTGFLAFSALPTAAGGVELVDLVGRLPVERGNQLVVRTLAEVRSVVVHWSAGVYASGYDPVAAYVAEALDHISRDWSEEEPGVQGGFGLMYQERISREGRAYRTRPAEHVVWAARRANRRGYNVALDAGPECPPTDAQMGALAARVRAVRLAYGLPVWSVWGHGELVADGNRTDCPGDLVTEWCRAYRRGEVD